jgi:hypothetical protein
MERKQKRSQPLGATPAIWIEPVHRGAGTARLACPSDPACPGKNRRRRNRSDGSRGPSPQSPQNERENPCRGGVKEPIRHVIADRGVSPQPVLQPKRAEEHRIILLGGAELGPDEPQSMHGSQRWLGHVGAVVPYKAAVEGGPVNEKRHRAEAGPRRKIAEPRSAGARFDRWVHRSQDHTSRPRVPSRFLILGVRSCAPARSSGLGGAGLGYEQPSLARFLHEDRPPLKALPREGRSIR